MFTRQEVTGLTNLTLRQLDYLDTTGLIIPTKKGNSKKPRCTYSWLQLIMLMAYSKLREERTFNQLKDAFVDMQDVHPFHLILDKKIIITNGKVLWLESDEMIAQKQFWDFFIEGVEHKKTLLAFPYIFIISDLIDEMRQNALANGVASFDDKLEQAKAA